MGIIAVDVGCTSGYSVMNEEGEIIMTGNIHADDLSTSVLAAWAKEEQHAVCIEFPAPAVYSSTATLRHAIEQVRQMFPHAYTVRPGVWKSSAVALQPLPDEVQGCRLSHHEKDAINIARWYRHHLDTTH